MVLKSIYNYNVCFLNYDIVVNLTQIIFLNPYIHNSIYEL
ncbi:hypothetical protein CMALT394_300075 [Carnobacterium maltaromaticum]|nr:hypothetical protein CMALT394_300075 [Carnobacterium maltaromaticum]